MAAPCAGKLLDPVVASVAMHSTLGAVAVRRMPPLALRQAPAIMMQSIGLISPAEVGVCVWVGVFVCVCVSSGGRGRPLG